MKKKNMYIRCLQFTMGGCEFLDAQQEVYKLLMPSFTDE